MYGSGSADMSGIDAFSGRGAVASVGSAKPVAQRNEKHERLKQECLCDC